jgi:hypothetical protein
VGDPEPSFEIFDIPGIRLTLVLPASLPEKRSWLRMDLSRPRPIDAERKRRRSTLGGFSQFA